MSIYKNTRDKDIRLTLFGVGEVYVPAGGQADIPEHVADVINGMTPVPSLVEVTDADDNEATQLEPSPRQQIMKALEELGVEFKRNASTESLEKLLEDALDAE